MGDNSRRLTLDCRSRNDIIKLGWIASQAGKEKSPKLDLEMEKYYKKCKYIGDKAYVSSMWIKGFRMYEECILIKVLNN